MGAKMSKKLKSVKNGLKHHQTILESHMEGFGGDWDRLERSDFVLCFLDLWCIFGVFLGYLSMPQRLTYISKLGCQKKKMTLMLVAGWWVPKNRKIEKSVRTCSQQYKLP